MISIVELTNERNEMQTSLPFFTLIDAKYLLRQTLHCHLYAMIRFYKMYINKN